MSNLAVISLDDMERVAVYAVNSKLFGAKDVPQAMSLMLLAQAEGLHPMEALQQFDVVQGRPARKTHSILARFQQAGGSVEWEEITGQRACGVFSHKQGGSLRVEWTFEQAKRVGLTGKDNWKNYPQAMLRARCIAEGVRAVFPGAIGGMMSVEEAQDTFSAPPKDMGMVETIDSGTIRAKWMGAAINAKTTGELEQVWKDGIKEVRATNDIDFYNSFKTAVINRKAELAAPVTIDENGVIEQEQAA